MTRKRVFVIYGRDTDAHNELSMFLTAIGLEERSFEAVANDLGGAPFVAEIVAAGIEQADAVIALFTPDELSVLYDPSTGLYQGHANTGSRWQARPNVIFEAGIAWGLAKERTILATIGRDVSLFSDIAGVHFIDLTRSGSKDALYKRLTRILGPLDLPSSNWESPDISGDFLKCMRRRWGAYDELHHLSDHLANINPTRGSSSLLEIVYLVTTRRLSTNWRHLKARNFVEAIKDDFNSDSVADNSYWWLVVAGFFRFDNIDHWLNGNHWNSSVDYAVIAERGYALIQKLSQSSS